MTTVTIHYFAQLGDLAGTVEEQRETGAANLAELYAEVARDRNLPADTSSIRVAVNEEFADWGDPLANGDIVAFMPPVSGG